MTQRLPNTTDSTSSNVWDLLTPEQSLFFKPMSNGKPYIDYEKVIALPEFKACEKIFEEAARLYSTDIYNEVSNLVSCIFLYWNMGDKNILSNSSVYCRKENTEKLAALLRAIGFNVQVVEKLEYGKDKFIILVEPNTLPTTLSDDLEKKLIEGVKTAVEKNIKH